MHTQVYMNLPVNDLVKSKAFFSALGYSFNPKFTDDNAGALVLGENIVAMLLQKEYFQTFTNKKIADAGKETEVLIALNVESRDAVNALVDKAIANGATEARDPQDYGFMFYRSYNDLDGHTWEIMYMDMEAFDKMQDEQE